MQLFPELARQIRARVTREMEDREKVLTRKSGKKKTAPRIGGPVPYPTGDDATALQTAIDAGGLVTLPEKVTFSPSRPVYLGNNCELMGAGATSKVYGGQHDGLIAMPSLHRNYNPAAHIVTNALDGSKWAFRSNAGVGSSAGAGIRIHNSIADGGWTGSDHWKTVRQFTVEMTITRYTNNGQICGQAWRYGDFRASPWRVYCHVDQPDRMKFALTLSNMIEYEYRFLVGVMTSNVVKYRFKVNLDAGTVICEKDDVVMTSIDYTHGPIPAGAVLAENPGAVLWFGGGGNQAGGLPQPELGSCDVAFHSFLLWKTATPPGPGSYNKHSWQSNTVLVFPFDNASKPATGDPKVGFTGDVTGYGYLVPWNAMDWCVGLRVENVTFSGEDYGIGLSIVCALDVVLNHLRFFKLRVGLNIMGGPLPNYPVAINDLYGENQRDCLARIHRSIIPQLSNVDVKYPKRSVLRFDDCGWTFVKNVFHAGESSGSSNTVLDVLRFDNGQTMSIENVLSNYEDGDVDGGPRHSYVYSRGVSSEGGTQVLRIKYFARQALRPTAKFIDYSEMDINRVVDVTDSFNMDIHEIPPIISTGPVSGSLNMRLK